jgi:hypothetical protein
MSYRSPDQGPLRLTSFYHRKTEGWTLAVRVCFAVVVNKLEGACEFLLLHYRYFFSELV